MARKLRPSSTVPVRRTYEVVETVIRSKPKDVKGGGKVYQRGGAKLYRGRGSMIGRGVEVC